MNALLVSANELVLDAGARSVVILAVAVIAVICLRRASAALRHLTGVAAMAGLLLLPVLSTMLPRWEVIPGGNPSEQVLVEQISTISGPQSQVNPASPLTAASVGSNIERPVTAVAKTSRFHVGWFILVLWVAGVFVALAPSVAGLISLRRLQRRADVVTEGAWLELLDDAYARLGLNRQVLLLKSGARRMPMTWGLRRTWVLLPNEADEWSMERRRMVLLHEVAHVKRWDYLTNLLTQIACALYWFNPLVWLMARWMVADRERACDDMVLQQGAKPAQYAEQILEIARQSTRNFALSAGIAMARATSLEGRIRAIVDSGRNRASVSRAAVLATIVVLAVVTIPIAMMGATATTEQRAAADPKALKFVRLVVEVNRLLFEGQPTTREDLGGLLEKVPNRQDTVLELAAANDNLPVKNYFQAQQLAAQLVERLGFAYLSNVGVQAPAPKEPPAQLGRWKFETMTIVVQTKAKTFLSLENVHAYAEMPSNGPTAYLERDADGLWQLMIHNAHNYPTEREQGMKLWQTRTAEEAAQPAGLAGVPFERTGTYKLRKDDLPVTILIPQWGLLQVSGIDERTDAVILQYKRVVAVHAEAAPEEPLSKLHLVQNGETLSQIAAVNGVSAKALRDANPDVDWRRLKVGQKVNIPAAGGRRL